MIVSLVKLARPQQWVKSAFVLFGPLYGLRDLIAQGRDWREVLVQALVAAGVFALASSACYVFNDLRDVERDRVHPRKRLRPIASGAVSPTAAAAMIVLLLFAAAGLSLLLHTAMRPITVLMVLIYVVNTTAYSAGLKDRVIADVISLSLGFVLRVLGGCFAVGISPSTWLLNCTLFLAMFLAFGKRLGERRTAEAAGYEASSARVVQGKYTDNLLRMAVVVTAVAALLTYAGYIQSRENIFSFAAFGVPAGFNWLWLTTLPALYAMLRSMVLIDRGDYDDPTEMFVKDGPLAIAGVGFFAMSVLVLVMQARLGG
ncbi:decaprenyl-phosphate phosphoribosyltransferase [Phycisphaerae bacterium]|nr:decaprenyl-phosphate phosphoribosyltransferase [Phycisphaerae bacterium]